MMRALKKEEDVDLQEPVDGEDETDVARWKTQGWEDDYHRDETRRGDRRRTDRC